MRSFELSTRIKAISRAKGRTATAAAAYRACEAIVCEREGKLHDFRRKRGLELAEIVLPDGAPAWAADRAKLWNAAELRERNKDRRAKSPDKANAQPAREFFFSFPAELSAAGRHAAARAIARHLADTHGIAADFALHQPGKDGDERNHHCHMLTTTRRLNEKGLGAKAREWDDRKTGPRLSKQIRAFIAGTLNAGLAAEGKGHLVRVEHLSFKARGSSQVATRHQGPGKTHALRKLQGQTRQAWLRQATADQRERHGQELAQLKLRQSMALQRKVGELADRARAGARAIREELAAQRRADHAPEGLRRAFLSLTGRAGREAFDRESRDAQRVTAAKTAIAELKAGLRAERAAFKDGQARDRAALIERHAREDRQLREAAQARQRSDRTAEARTRRADIEALDRQQRHELQRGGRSQGSELTP